MLNITTNDQGRAFFALPLIDKMVAVIFTQYNLSHSRAERQMAEAQAPSILTAGVILLHSMKHPVAGLEEVFEMLDEGYEQWRLGILRCGIDGDPTPEDFMKMLLEKVYDSAFYENAVISAEWWNENRPLLGYGS
jgi:hypothetical protein